MDSKQKNQAAYRQKKQELAERYPVGWFVAFDDGEIVSDAASFDALTAALTTIGKDRPDVFVVQAGVNYPDRVDILIDSTPRERLERAAELQRRAMELLASSPDGYRRYWERNLRQRSIHAEY